MYRIRSNCVVTLSVLFLSTGCQLPNVGPFVDATGQLKSAVAAGGSTVEEALRFSPNSQVELDQFTAGWKARNNAFTAMLNYADSLDAIVSAGNAGAETAGKVADSVKALATAAGIAVPASPAVAVATDTAKFIAGQITKIVAAENLSKALEQAQPAIEVIAQLLRKDIQDLKPIVNAAYNNADTAIVSDPKFNQLYAYRKSLTKEMEKNTDASVDVQRTAITNLNKILAETDARLAPLFAKLEQNDQRRRTAAQLLAATASALDAWSAAHAQLAVAARNKTAVSVTSLIQTTTELRDLIKRMREL